VEATKFYWSGNE